MIHQVIQIYYSTLEFWITDILNLLFLYDFFIFFHEWYRQRFDKATYLSLPFKFILSGRLSNSLRGSDNLLLSKFINIVSILYYTFTEFITLLYTFLVISFPRYKECMIWQISISKFSDLILLVQELLEISEAYI